MKLLKRTNGKARTAVMSISGANYMAFASGIQVAIGISIFVYLYNADGPHTNYPFVAVAGFLFLFSGFISMRLTWECNAVRRIGDLAEDTVLKPRDVMKDALSERVRLLGFPMRRLSKLYWLVAFDAMTTLAALAVAAGTKLIWQ